MTREEFLARCANAYDAGLVTPASLKVLERWVEFRARLQAGQVGYALDTLIEERSRTDNFRRSNASDADGYAVIQLAAILTHHCPICAVDPDAWWTRGAFCPHKKRFGEEAEQR